MGNDQKDRFGDKMRDLEHAREDKFFAERDKELLAKLRAKQRGESCPVCGEPLRIEDGSRSCPNGHPAS
jgi:DNA repair exonuclease SbcCD ATPase subunit